ncbi:hypothetical protein ACFVH6_12055 [Spirillospora sp. NPDC127200]
MPLIDKIKRFARSPQGQRAGRIARDPRTQAKARGLLARFRGKGRGAGGTGRRY